MVDDRAGGKGRPAGHRVRRRQGHGEAFDRPMLRDLYQAAADAGFRDDDMAFVAGIYR